MPAEDLRFPLRWPADWKRTPRPGAARFERRSMAEVRERLLRELRLAGVPPWSIQISTNVPLTSRGQAASGICQPADRGAAVYFQHGEQLLVSACDKWNRVEDNLYAIALDVEAVRGRLRWGVVSIERALAGHQRLGAPAQILLGPGDAPAGGAAGAGGASCL